MNENRWKILHIVNIGTFMSTLDVGIVNVALPTMANQFGTSLASIQWIVTSYLLTMVALLPLFGRISDRLDRSKVYCIGFLLFSVGSLLIAVFTDFTGVIIARCIQGIGATMIMANSQAMVRQVFPNQERGKALGINAIIISLGTLSGPAIGGILLEYFGWQALFIINVPFGVIAMLLGFRLFPKVQHHTKEKLDIIGSLLLAIGASLLMLGASKLEQQGLTNYIITLLITGCLLLIILIVYEVRLSYGIIDKELFSNRTIAIGNASGFLIHLTQMATLIPITFYIQEILGYSTWKIGLILSIQPLFMGIAAPLSGWYRDKYGASLPLLLGSLFCSVAMLFITFAKSISFSDLAWHFAIFGIGLGLFQAINNAEIMTATPGNKISLSGSMLALIRYFGMIVGIGLATSFAGNLGTGDYDLTKLTTSIQSLFGICAFLCLAVSIFVFFRTENKKQKKTSDVNLS